MNTQIHPKVAMGGVGGAIAIILVWLVSLTGLTMPNEVIVAITTICGFIAGYMTSSPNGNPPSQ